jgi:hypothetical protein
VPAPPERRPRDERLLELLRYRVAIARADVHLGRAMPPGPLRVTEQDHRCERLRDALQAYSDASSAAGVPLPYRYRDELRLYSAMYPLTPR